MWNRAVGGKTASRQRVAAGFKRKSSPCVIGINYTSPSHWGQQRSSDPTQSATSDLTKVADQAKPRSFGQEFFESILSASATKRDAKGFLARFSAQQDKCQPTARPLDLVLPPPRATTVNLGALYQPFKAVEDNPVFATAPRTEASPVVDEQIHAVIVRIRAIQNLEDETLAGIGKTLVQLGNLGVRSVVVLDFPDKPLANTAIEHLQSLKHQSQRFTSLLHKIAPSGARLVEQALVSLKPDQGTDAVSSHAGGIVVSLPELILFPLRRGVIPVISPICVSQDHRLVTIRGNEIVKSLTRLLSDGQTTLASSISLDRIIFLDPDGGIPNPSAHYNAHIFINLAQEYEMVQQQLLSRQHGSTTSHSRTCHYLDNLDSMKHCLSMLPASASGLLTTPTEVAHSASFSHESTPSGVRTRPRQNRLIHNILTDKPQVSSSLPHARMNDVNPWSAPVSTSTFFKLGVPIQIIPDPYHVQWTAPEAGGLTMNLQDDRVDLPKLFHLINDSFGRFLDEKSYLNRVRDQVAGVIIAGDYEGGAILTWEKPFGRPHRPAVPYLDKFAVLRHSQGSGGVADILFNAMIRRCFPRGVVWRSRRNNPVNKWYFERAAGTWRIPDSNWTMFWTGNHIRPDPSTSSTNEIEERWKDYVAVCANIQPTWLDGKPPD